MLIVCNWKAYVETESKAKKLFASAKRLGASGLHQIVLAPPAPYLGLLASGNRTKVAFAGQDVSPSLGGAATGEVTAAVLKDAGASYVIIGHSERRAMGETNAIVLEKVQHALAHGLIPILCFGELKRDSEAHYLGFIRTQLSSVFEALSPKERLHVVLAYEPIWAIGKSAEDAITARDLTEMVLYIRKVLGDYLPGRGASKVKILYGGSVEAENIRPLAGSTAVDGFLIGRASVDSSTLGSLVKAVS